MILDGLFGRIKLSKKGTLLDGFVIPAEEDAAAPANDGGEKRKRNDGDNYRVVMLDLLAQREADPNTAAAHLRVDSDRCDPDTI